MDAKSKVAAAHGAIRFIAESDNDDEALVRANLKEVRTFIDAAEKSIATGRAERVARRKAEADERVRLRAEAMARARGTAKPA